MVPRQPRWFAALSLLLVLMSGCTPHNVGLQRQVQEQSLKQTEYAQLLTELQTELADQQAHLESDRRDIAESRWTEPLFAEALSLCGKCLICALPMLLLWQLLRQGPSQGDEQEALCEVLLEDLQHAPPRLDSPEVKRLEKQHVTGNP